MKLIGNMQATGSLTALTECGLLKAYERQAVGKLAGSPFQSAVDAAETVHLHIKVDDTHQLPLNRFFEAGARLDHQKDGFVKWRFPGGINAIFSHIKVSQDELLETPATRRPRPFLDHIGIDLRDETQPVRRVFDSLPDKAGALDWTVASQGGPGKPVYCCHVEVAEKHWVYPPDEAAGRPGIPLEFAYGVLKVNPDKSGCDLRLADASKVDPAALAAVSCCGAPGDHGHAGAGGNHQAPPHGAADAGGAGNGTYYRAADLGRFGEISRVNPELGAGFFAYYNRVMADGLLDKREKGLIALAVAHALKWHLRDPLGGLGWGLLG